MHEFADAEPVGAYGNLDEGILMAGDRAPDAPGLITVVSRAETRLFDVFSPTAHVHSRYIDDDRHFPGSTTVSCG